MGKAEDRLDARADVAYGPLKQHVPLATRWRVGAAVSVVNISIWLGIGAAWWKLLGLW